MGFHPGWNEISELIGKSDRIFLKKLSRNDSSWADSRGNGHQNGFFIPREIAESDYFPELRNSNDKKPHILDCEYPTFWPASGERMMSKIKYYSKRFPGNLEKERPRYEWQHTGVPKEQFQGLPPASLLIGGSLKSPIADANYWFIVVDSMSQEAEIIETVFELAVDFHFQLFDPSAISPRLSDTEALIEELSQALKEGTLEKFIKSQTLPSPDELARSAQASWLRECKISDMNPYSVASPGDAVMKISRDIEYSLYKKAELRYRAAQVAQTLLYGKGDPVSNLVRGFAELDSIFLSASQTRKSRAGLSFEHHVERLFIDGRIRYEAQAIFGGRRPDFVLPDVTEINKKGDALIVSLKTTLRERWKQLALEKQHGTIFLATVDDRVSSEAIDEMQRNRIGLVVPESLKRKRKDAESVYGSHTNVISFRQFFDEEVRTKRPSLILPL
jgi:hypothetical protein